MRNEATRDVGTRRRAILVSVIAISNGFGCGLLAAELTRWFILPAVIIPIACGAYALTIRCPVCGAPIYKRRAKVGGIEFTYWGGLVPRRCDTCGAPLD